MLKGLAPLINKFDREITPNEILEAHARHESFQQLQTPGKSYREILAIVYRRLAEEWRINVDWDECVTYGDSVKNWEAFPDSTDALKYLKQYYKLVILSNVDHASFAKSNKRLAVDFDAVYTAEAIGSYKPADANFEYMLRMLNGLGYKKSDILHTAESMFHDHAPANKHGIKSCWIYRRHAKEGFGATMPPDQLPTYDFRFNSMAELAEAHRLETGN